MTSTADVTYFDVACSFIHKVVTRPKIIPYKDMVKWVIDHLKIEDRTFKDSKGENIGSFRGKGFTRNVPSTLPAVEI